MKRIVILGPAPPFRGGISQFALILGQEFQNQGDEVRFFTFERQYPKLIFPGSTQTTSFPQDLNITVERAYTPHQPASWKKAVQSIKGWNPDLLIVSWFLPWFAPSYTWICKRLPNIRRICLAHNVDFHEKWPGADLLSKAFFKQCDKIVTLSGATFADLKRKFPRDVSVKGIQGFHPIYDCYGGSQDSSPQDPERDPTALFFGLIKAYKGLDVLLKAVKQARKRVPRLRLLIAGEVYGKPEKYLLLIHQLGLEDAVDARFHYISNDEIADIFNQAQVCVLPYKSATQSGVIASSYSFGVPVIASDVGGLSEYIDVEKTGLLVPPNNPEALAGALIRYFEGNLFQAMKPNIPAFVEQFSWQKLAELVLNA
ncbi:MAG: glycosyltransferase family 4 protein [Candidatus Cloacimonetes bacterium]|nr:glycosyltransferase family 4 protein [Candidatus Cloacimonadota bacterium]